LLAAAVLADFCVGFLALIVPSCRPLPRPVLEPFRVESWW
jgi:hypothetical protein